MISAIDTSIILDILTEDKKFADLSENILNKASLEGKLIICECVITEIFPAFKDESDFKDFLNDWQLDYMPSIIESSILAGEHFKTYLNRGGKAKRVLLDFLIGAHAYLLADRLLARDRGYFRDYFKKLKIIDPDTNFNF